MKICVVGSGYVGLVAGVCFAQMGNSVICLDNDEDKIAKLKRGEVPIYEASLDEMLAENSAAGRLSFSTDAKEAISSSQAIFIAVGTPMGDDGSADLRFVCQVAESIGEFLGENAKNSALKAENQAQKPKIQPLMSPTLPKRFVIVNKSTVPVGTARKVRGIIEQGLAKRGVKVDFAVVSNPEFLKEGVAIKDFMSPERVIVGADEGWAVEFMRSLYAPFLIKSDRFIAMGVESAEMSKYAANAMLATKISFINEMSQICELVGANINDVRLGIGSDTRIGYSFIYPGCGYGGSCFPKDVKALEKTALDKGYVPSILQAVQSVNAAQKRVLATKITACFGEDLSGREFGVWGLSFKPQTDDMREASSIVLIRELVSRGARVRAYDPKAREQAKFYLGDIMELVRLCENPYEALANADAMVLVTEWKEFRSPNFDEIKALLKTPVIFDGRNIYQHLDLAKKGFRYYQIGVR